MSFAYKMAAKTSGHIYGTKLRHCHPVLTVVHPTSNLEYLTAEGRLTGLEINPQEGSRNGASGWE